MEHTKEKWEYKQASDGVSFEIFAGDVWIAHVYMGRGMKTIEQVEANARLIVAAPKLLAIKQISYEAICTGDQEASDKAIGLIEDFDAAIAEAEK